MYVLKTHLFIDYYSLSINVTCRVIVTWSSVFVKLWTEDSNTANYQKFKNDNQV